MKHFKTTLLVAATSILVAGCGGGTSPTADTTPRASITTVKAFGDSLADAGTFGFKFTVQDGKVYPQVVAQSYGQSNLCNFYVFTGTTFAANSTAGCTDFAIGGGVINPASSTSATVPSPVGIQVQMTTAGSIGFAATDLAVIDGGGNDIAALITAFLTAQQTSNPTSLVTLLTSLSAANPALSLTAVQTALAGGATTTAQIGGVYMATLADVMASSVTTNVLGKGATHVVILNLPAVTKTPEFQAVLAQISAANGGGATGAAAAAQAEGLFETWMSAYNAELTTKFASEPRVAVIDFYDAFLDEVAEPQQYGLVPVAQIFNEACPAADNANSTAAAAGWIACTAANLSANPPSGVTDPNWWKTYAFANQFHPTPYGHQLIAQLISRTLAQKGWL